jgi:hypothetical protein
MGIAIKLDVSNGLQRIHATTAEAKRAIPRALNKVATTTVARTARAVRDAGYNMKIGDIKKAIVVKRANGEDRNIVLSAKNKPLPLSYFNPTGGGTPQHRLPIRVRVMRQTVTLNHAFFVQLSSGHRGVFSRRDKSGNISSRLPITQMYGPSLVNAINNETVQSVTAATIEERWPIEIASQMSDVLARR